MDFENILNEQFNNVITVEDLNELTKKAEQITGHVANDFSIENILNKTLEGQSIFNSTEIIDNFKELILLEVKTALVLCVEILSICVIIGILKGLSSSFNSKSVSEISLLICSMIIIGISINTFNDTYNLALETASVMTNTMEILMPILIGILISTGSIASGTILSPIIIGAVTLISFLIKKVILPALFISTTLSLINCLTEKDYVNKLSKLLRNTSVGLTGILIVLLTGVITIQGLISETSDGILINTAKYSLSNFIPIVGGFTSDTVELFIKCMTSIKSIVGIFGIILLILLISVPLIKILVIALIYKLTAALAEPITDAKTADGLNDMGSCVISIASILFFNSLLFIIFISTIINIGGS